MRDVDATLKYYADHKPGATPWPFDPDGMCLKVCRWARDIPPMFPSAVSAQVGTPLKYRVPKLEDVRRGMVMYFDDPNDDNPFGHIVTVRGRDKDGGILTWSNSVKSNQVVTVYSTFYPREWGDRFQFAARWLNGFELDTGRSTIDVDDPDPVLREFRTLQKVVDILMGSIAHHKQKGDNRLVKALQRDLAEVRETMKENRER